MREQLNVKNNKTAQYEFTVVVPVYNEEDNIEALEKRLGAWLAVSQCHSCVLFVNDGSKDSSAERLHQICSRNPDFYYLDFEHNRGLSAALKAGIDYTDSQYLGYIDADLQTAPEDFEILLPHRKDFPLVMGIRANRKDSFFKGLQSKIANSYRRMMTHDGATDTGCPLKVMQTAYARRLPLFNGMHRFLPALIQLQEGGRMMQIPVRHFPRVAGVSKYHLWNRLIGPFVDCFAYRWMRKRYINYSVKEDNL